MNIFTAIASEEEKIVINNEGRGFFKLRRKKIILSFFQLFTKIQILLTPLSKLNKERTKNYFYPFQKKASLFHN